MRRALAGLAVLTMALAACTSPGRSDPLTTPPTTQIIGGDGALPKHGNSSIPFDANASLLDQFIPDWPKSEPLDEQQQSRIDGLVTGWFQDVVKGSYTVVDHRFVVTENMSPWYYYSGQVLQGRAGAMGASEDSYVSLLKLQPPTSPNDYREKGWPSPKYLSLTESTAWAVERPHPGVVAAVLLPEVLQDKRVLLAYFELKPTTGLG